jgi:hypothetical protein
MKFQLNLKFNGIRLDKIKGEILFIKILSEQADLSIEDLAVPLKVFFDKKILYK